MQNQGIDTDQTPYDLFKEFVGKNQLGHLYKKIREQWKKNTHVGPGYPRKDNRKKLSSTDKSALQSYTISEFAYINSQLRSERPDANARFLAQQLADALKQLPPYHGLVYRKSDHLPGDFPKDLLPEVSSVGKRSQTPLLMSDKGFLSTSHTDFIAFDGQYSLVIESFSGKLIEEDSHTTTEREVLFAPESIYLYQGIDKQKNIRLKEVDPLNWKMDLAPWFE